LNQESTLLEFDCAKDKYRIASINIYDEKMFCFFPHRSSARIGRTFFPVPLMKSLKMKFAGPVARLQTT